MRTPTDSGQSDSRNSGAFAALVFAAVVAAGSAAWFFSAGPAATISDEVPLPRSTTATIPRIEAPLPTAISRSPEQASERPPIPIAPFRNTEPAPSLAVLEQRFVATRAKEDRIELAREIAGPNDAAAVATLARIFSFERHPEIKVALLASLNDIDHDQAPDVRLAMLATALRGQPRDVRTTALDSLAQLDDPRVPVLLKKSMQEDPDKEVRDLAASLYRAVTATR